MLEWTRREALHGSAAIVAATGLSLTATETAEAKRERKAHLKILIAGAHPDDPESACGGAMALYADAGHEVVSLYLTRGEAGIPGKSYEEAARIRTAEAEAACRILKARPVFAGQVDGATEVTAQAYDEINKILVDERPDTVITHWPIDTHRDHRVIAMLVFDAWLRSAKRFDLYYFEVEAGDQTQHFSPTHYVDISVVEDRKRQACFAQASQNPELGFYALHERMHRFRGREAGVKSAEAFIRHHHARRDLL